MKICPNCFSSKGLQQNKCVICGFSNTKQRDARALPVEKMLNKRYIIGRVLGIGGFGITYVAYDVDKKERIALKEYFPTEWAMRMAENQQIVPNSQGKSHLYEHGRDVFVNEANVLHQLQEVKTVVDVKDFFTENGTAYMAMELVEGYTLNRYIKYQNEKRLSYSEANKIIKTVAMALYEVHKKGLLHRDVGPDNIMITPQKEIRLIDFGATRLYGLNSPRSMSVLVKEGFAPIEQYSRGGRQGPWTDVYALAATYYYLVTGHKPVEAPERISGKETPELCTVIPSIPQNINDAITHAMEQSWRDRPQGMKEFLTEMGLISSASKLPKTVWGWEKAMQNANGGATAAKRPCILMQVGTLRQRYYFMDDNTLCIGRSNKQSNLVIEKDPQVSGLHCKLWYDARAERFVIENHSGNRTFTIQKILEKGEYTYLMRGEWFYIQTQKERYIFYLEVE